MKCSIVEGGLARRRCTVKLAFLPMIHWGYTGDSALQDPLYYNITYEVVGSSTRMMMRSVSR